MKFAEKFADVLAGENDGWACRDLLIGKTARPCVTCKEPTHFIDVCSEGHICSEECETEFYVWCSLTNEEMKLFNQLKQIKTIDDVSVLGFLPFGRFPHPTRYLWLWEYDNGMQIVTIEHDCVHHSFFGVIIDTRLVQIYRGM